MSDDCSASGVWLAVFSPFVVPLLITGLLIIFNLLLLVMKKGHPSQTPKVRKFNLFVCFFLTFLWLLLGGKAALVAQDSTKLPCEEFYHRWHAARASLPW